MDATQLNRPQPLQPHEQVALESLVATAATTLATAFATTLRLLPIETFAYQPHIIRCQVQSTRADLPTTIIIKQARNRGGQIYRPDDPSFWGLAHRLFNEWAGAYFLQAVAPTAHFGPLLFAANRQAGFIVLEDLGNDTSVKDALLGRNSQQAEIELLTLAATLGRLHAATVSHRSDFEQVRDGLGPRDPTMYPRYAWYLQNSLGSLQVLWSEFGIEPDSRLTSEVTMLATALAEPGEFAVYTHGDPCPLNWLRHNSTLRAIDFEFGGFEHALLDAMHGRMLFPTYGFPQGIPQALIQGMEHQYRSELVKGCQVAADDSTFARAAVEACAFWIVFCLLRDLKPALSAQDASAKITAQCLVARLQAFIIAAEGNEQFPALRATAHSLIAKLVEVWSTEAYALPDYPAFRPSELENERTASSAT
jgi:hypothetical protein